jgi:hypothetical protein
MRNFEKLTGRQWFCQRKLPRGQILGDNYAFEDGTVPFYLSLTANTYKYCMRQSLPVCATARAASREYQLHQRALAASNLAFLEPPYQNDFRVVANLSFRAAVMF